MNLPGGTAGGTAFVVSRIQKAHGFSCDAARRGTAVLCVPQSNFARRPQVVFQLAVEGFGGGVGGVTPGGVGAAQAAVERLGLGGRVGRDIELLRAAPAGPGGGCGKQRRAGAFQYTGSWWGRVAFFILPQTAHLGEAAKATALPSIFLNPLLTLTLRHGLYCFRAREGYG